MFRKGVGGQRGLARRSPSNPRDLGLFSVPFFLCPLRRTGTYFWRTFGLFLGCLFVANPLPPTPFRNLRYFWPTLMFSGFRALSEVFCFYQALISRACFRKEDGPKGADPNICLLQSPAKILDLLPTSQRKTWHRVDQLQNRKTKISWK